MISRPQILTRQRGVALITAVLIAAIVATLGVYLSLDQAIWQRQSQHIAAQVQQRPLHRTAAEFAAVLLNEEAKNSSTDHLGEDWAKQTYQGTLDILEQEDGLFLASASDAQASINLNNLALANGGPNKAQLEMFRRLLQLLDLDEGLPETVLDWIDNNDTRSANGAEDNDYLSLALPYRAANRDLQSLQELRLLKGVTNEVFDELKDHVTVLPRGSKINVNTASATVIATMFNKMTLSEAEQLIKGRESDPFDSTAKFKQRAAGQTLAIGENELSVNTEYFAIIVTTDYAGRQSTTRALIHRPIDKNKPAKVLWQGKPSLVLTMKQQQDLLKGEQAE